MVEELDVQAGRTVNITGKVSPLSSSVPLPINSGIYSFFFWDYMLKQCLSLEVFHMRIVAFCEVELIQWLHDYDIINTFGNITLHFIYPKAIKYLKGLVCEY